MLKGEMFVQSPNCFHCHESMTKVALKAGGDYGFLEKPNKGLFAKSPQSRINVFVCPKCGRTEFFAEMPMYIRFRTHSNR